MVLNKERRKDGIICIICSVTTSVVTTKILATHYFEIVGDYVKGICDMTKDFVESMKDRFYK